MKKIVFYLMICLALATSTTAGMVDRFMDACEGGSMEGCYQAGVVYWTGEGADKDIKAARSLLEISCDGGYDTACVALHTMNGEDSVEKPIKAEVLPAVKKKRRYTGHIDGKLRADIDRDGKEETVAWKKFASVDLGDYYQLLVIDDDGSLLWEGPKKQDYEDPLVFFYLDYGRSLPQLLMDVDQDGFVELLAPMAQSDVSPTYFRKLRWRGSYFEPLLSNALMQSASQPRHFDWKTTQKSYGTWISKLTPYGNGLVKANVMKYRKNGGVRMGTALIKFDRRGATVDRWLKPMSGANDSGSSSVPPAAHKTMGLIHGLDPHGDGFLSIRKKPNATEIGRLYNGDRVEILGRKGKWFKIRAVRSGRVGWSFGRWIHVY